MTQVREVVGDEVAHGDRQQPGTRGRKADEPGDQRAAGTDDDPEERDEEERLGRGRRDAEQRRRSRVWDSPSKMIDPVPSATRTTIAARPAALEEPAGEPRRRTTPSVPAPSTSANGASRPRSPNQTPKRLAVLAPGVAPELGHHRQGEGGVDDDDQAERPRPGARGDELEPDERREPATAGHRPRAAGYSAAARPSTPSRRGRTQPPRSWSVENGSSQRQIGTDERATRGRRRPSRRPTGRATRLGVRIRHRTPSGP